MFSIRDFFHLPQIDAWVDRLGAGQPGLTIIAGLDARPGITFPPQGLLPSGRSAIFSILIEQVLTSSPKTRCHLLALDKQTLRVPRQLRRQVQFFSTEAPFSYAGRVEEALKDRPTMLVIDCLDADSLQPAIRAAQEGLFVLAQFDTVLYGAEVIDQLYPLGMSESQRAVINCILSVQRLQTLCAQCKTEAPLSPDQAARLRSHPLLASPGPLVTDLLSGLLKDDLQVYQEGSCPSCQGTGRRGEAMVFDIFHPNAGPGDHNLPLAAYVGRLAELGYLSLEDFLDFENRHRRRMAYTLLSLESVLAAKSNIYERKQAELEAANRVLTQRTRSLISLRELGQAMVTSDDLQDLANRVCRFALDLCGADRVIVYYSQSIHDAEALASGGWGTDRVPRKVDPSTTMAPAALQLLEKAVEPVAFNFWPPGIPPRNPDVEGAELRAGLLVPLIAQEKRVGFILAHPTRKPAFLQAEISMLHTLAQQAALGIQRARLIENLHNKIASLEAAQKELAQKERMERELELARQVQQSMLPRAFPQAARCRFAARSLPARWVGGDFYDVIPLQAGNIGIAIADVSDKGLPAALLMALTRSLLRAEAPRQSSPQAVVERINQLLIELVGDLSMFVTLFYAVVEPGSRRLTYCRAGHDYPMLLRGGSARLLAGTGTPLGIWGKEEEFKLSEETLFLESGDRLALYSDGLTDVLSEQGEMFDRERLTSLLVEASSLPLSEMCTSVFSSLLAFQGDAEQHDDMTLLLIEMI